jgi:hypothetical protein
MATTETVKQHLENAKTALAQVPQSRQDPMRQALATQLRALEEIAALLEEHDRKLKAKP